ncbi:MAG: DNA translocase FtsK [Candidatus Omnitrophica bacterium]|nr:DNA translocase FtsK [Candidatus Omnitrophota bacterium]
MNEQKRNEVLAAFWSIVSVVTLIALATYTPQDIPFEVSLPNQPVKNWAGPAGAYTAWFFILFFGKTAYFLVPLFLFWSFAKWSGKKSQKLWLKLFSTVIFLASSCAGFSLVGEVTEINRFQSGGIIGFFVSSVLSSLFGKAGLLVALLLFLLSVVLATELLVLQIAMAFFKKCREWAAPVLAKRPEKKALLTPESVSPAKLPQKMPPVIAAKMTAGLQAAVERAQAALVKPQIKIAGARPELGAAQAALKKEELPLAAEPVAGDYRLPTIDLLQDPPAVDQGKLKSNLEESSRILEDTLRDFGIEAKVVEVEQGPTIARYELQPAAGVKVQRITSLENDISLAMRATSVRIIAPIPGKSRVGIEVPNSLPTTVYLKDVLSSVEFRNEISKVTIVIGKDTAGSPLVCNLADMPHLLIAGATNTGKSVCINSVLMSMLFRATPEDVKFLIIDPKMVELHFYNELPHLICPVVTDRTKVPGVLAWLVTEMERRYRVFSKVGAKNLLAFNQKVENKEITPQTLKIDDSNEDEPVLVKKMPYIVLVIDELADLMLASAQEVETAITRLAQLARAVGIHMILATQRPSVDVITGVIKANFPARIAFQVASKVDSRTILDENGADKLLGRGDLLLMDPRKSKLVRAQGAWVQDTEIEKVIEFIKSQRKAVYHEAVIQSQEKKQSAFGDFRRDEVYDEAKRIVLETGQASVSMVQRRLGLGYTRAARLIDMMEEDGIVGPYRGAKPREILVERPNAPVQEKESP